MIINNSLYKDNRHSSFKDFSENDTNRSLFMTTSVLRVSSFTMKVNLYQTILTTVIISLSTCVKVRHRFDWKAIENHVVRSLLPKVNRFLESVKKLFKVPAMVCF